MTYLKRTLVASIAMTALCLNLVAQVDSLNAQQTITISGTVREEQGQPVSNIIIINKRTRKGSFGRADGSFVISCNKTDTLSVTSLGYFTRMLCYKDSVLKDTYYPVVYIEQRTYVLAQAEIFAQRDLEQIQKDIEKLGYNEKDYMLSGINTLQSPITFLYQQFSRKEQSKRLVAQMENEDRKRELLKELFHHYVDYQIIDLSNEEFDEFVNFINVSDDFLKSSTQYDFLIYVKERFKDYKVAKRQKHLTEGDYDYDKD